MKKLQLLVFFALILLSVKGMAQNELIYVPELSEKKKATKSKQLEGMVGTVEKVTLQKQKDNKVELNIYLNGYTGKYLKIFALSTSGSRKYEIPPYIKKVASGKKLIYAHINLAGSKAISTDFIEIVFTNGALRFKGVPYIYKFKKDWVPKELADAETSGNSRRKQSQIVELHLKPVEKARQTFIR